MIIVVVVSVVKIFRHQPPLPPGRSGWILWVRLGWSDEFNLHSIAKILFTCALIFSSCVLFTVFFTHIMKRHPTRLPVTSYQRAGG